MERCQSSRNDVLLLKLLPVLAQHCSERVGESGSDECAD